MANLFIRYQCSLKPEVNSNFVWKIFSLFADWWKMRISIHFKVQYNIGFEWCIPSMEIKRQIRKINTNLNNSPSVWIREKFKRKIDIEYMSTLHTYIEQRWFIANINFLFRKGILDFIIKCMICVCDRMKLYGFNWCVWNFNG